MGRIPCVVLLLAVALIDQAFASTTTTAETSVIGSTNDTVASSAVTATSNTSGTTVAEYNTTTEGTSAATAIDTATAMSSSTDGGETNTTDTETTPFSDTSVASSTDGGETNTTDTETTPFSDTYTPSFQSETNSPTLNTNATTSFSNTNISTITDTTTTTTTTTTYIANSTVVANSSSSTSSSNDTGTTSSFSTAAPSNFTSTSASSTSTWNTSTSDSNSSTTSVSNASTMTTNVSNASTMTTSVSNASTMTTSVSNASTMTTSASNASTMTTSVSNASTMTTSVSNASTMTTSVSNASTTTTSLSSTTSSVSNASSTSVSNSSSTAAISSSTSSSSSTQPTSTTAPKTTAATMPSSSSSSSTRTTTQTTPAITALSSIAIYWLEPTLAPNQVSVTITIVGNSFTPAVVVLFGGSPCSTQTFVSSGSILCNPPVNNGLQILVSLANVATSPVYFSFFPASSPIIAILTVDIATFNTPSNIALFQSDIRQVLLLDSTDQVYIEAITAASTAVTFLVVSSSTQPNIDVTGPQSLITASNDGALANLDFKISQLTVGSTVTVPAPTTSAASSAPSWIAPLLVCAFILLLLLVVAVLYLFWRRRKSASAMQLHPDILASLANRKREEASESIKDTNSVTSSENQLSARKNQSLPRLPRSALRLDISSSYNKNGNNDASNNAINIINKSPIKDFSDFMSTPRLESNPVRLNNSGRLLPSNISAMERADGAQTKKKLSSSSSSVRPLNQNIDHFLNSRKEVSMRSQKSEKSNIVTVDTVFVPSRRSQDSSTISPEMSRYPTPRK